MASGPDGTLYVAWRKILPGDLRETVVARSTDGGATYSAPVIVGHDRWVFPGCPHRPASVGTDRQGRLYVAWYTEGSDETPSIYLAYSDDKGETFSPKQKLNFSKGTFPDHPQMAVDQEGRVILVWEEQSPVRREVVVSVSLDRGQSFVLGDGPRGAARVAPVGVVLREVEQVEGVKRHRGTPLLFERTSDHDLAVAEVPRRDPGEVPVLAVRGRGPPRPGRWD